ncbi:unnamed protein product [Leuciscus chuanchicus]
MAGLGYGSVVDLDRGAVVGLPLTMNENSETVLGLDHQAEDYTLEEQVATVYPTEIDTIRVELVDEMTTSAEKMTLMDQGAMDMRPISVVDGAGFREFCQAMEPRYRIPSRGTVTNRLVEVYNSTSDKIKESIKDKDVALTTDEWTSLANSILCYSNGPLD